MNLFNYKEIIMVVPRSVQGILGALMVSNIKSCIITNTRTLNKEEFRRINKIKGEGIAVVYLNIHIQNNYCDNLDVDKDHYFILKPIDTMFINISNFYNVNIITTDDVVGELFKTVIPTPFNVSLKNIVRIFYKHASYKNIRCCQYTIGENLRNFIKEHPEYTLKEYESYVRSKVDEYGLLSV